jgi:broad specificity phosphatase PhoE
VPPQPARAQEVVLVRHGETEWSRSGRHTGRTDLDLTDAGRKAAAALARVLAERAFAAVFVSPMQRSIETARLAGLGAHAEMCADLREWDYGDYEGRTTREIRAEVPGWTVWTHALPNGETADEVAARVDRVIDRARRVDGDVAIFGHGHSLRVLGVRWCARPPTEGQILALSPASVSVLGYERETAVIRQWNRVPDVRNPPNRSVS